MKLNIEILPSTVGRPYEVKDSVTIKMQLVCEKTQLNFSIILIFVSKVFFENPFVPFKYLNNKCCIQTNHVKMIIIFGLHC